MDLLTFVPENLIILIAATYVVGLFLKKSESVKDKHIVIILMVFTVIFSVIINNTFNVQGIANAILEGILCWGVAVGANQVKKQIVKED